MHRTLEEDANFMEHQFTLLKDYLSKLSDNDLKTLYHKELIAENAWSDLSNDVYLWVALWIARKPERGEWAILNEIARRWVNVLPEGDVNADTNR